MIFVHAGNTVAADGLGQRHCLVVGTIHLQSWGRAEAQSRHDAHQEDLTEYRVSTAGQRRLSHETMSKRGYPIPINSRSAPVYAANWDAGTPASLYCFSIRRGKMLRSIIVRRAAFCGGCDTTPRQIDDLWLARIDKSTYLVD